MNEYELHQSVDSVLQPTGNNTHGREIKPVANEHCNNKNNVTVALHVEENIRRNILSEECNDNVRTRQAAESE